MAKEETPVAEPPAPKKRGKLLIIILAVVGVLVIGGGVAAYLLLSGGEHDAKHGEEETAQQEEPPPIYEKLETFTVRLADQESYLQIDIQLAVADAKVQEKIKARLPEVRDAMIRLLSGKTPEELSKQDGMDELADDIERQVNDLLGIKGKNKGVIKVLFGAFIIQ
jgi:flagellar FliL protein